MNISVFRDYIKNVIALSDNEESLLFSAVKERKYLKGQYILQQGDPCHFLNFVVSGATKTFHLDDKGNENIFRFAIEKWWATDLPSFINQDISNTNIQCLENTVVVQISLESFEKLTQEIPQFERFFRLLFQNVSITLEKRIINNLSFSAKERYLLFREEYREFEQRIPQYMIASYLGISKQYLSEIRNQLTSEL